jgi:hypothetical protein
MAKPRLTPNQKRLLKGVSTWGTCFITYTGEYSFLVNQKLVRKATAEEINAHYTGLRAELDDTNDQLLEATVLRDYNEVKSLAAHALYLCGELNDRADDEDRLAVLTPEARELAASLEV